MVLRARHITPTPPTRHTHHPSPKHRPTNGWLDMRTTHAPRQHHHYIPRVHPHPHTHPTTRGIALTIPPQIPHHRRIRRGRQQPHTHHHQPPKKTKTYSTTDTHTHPPIPRPSTTYPNHDIKPPTTTRSPHPKRKHRNTLVKYSNQLNIFQCKAWKPPPSAPARGAHSLTETSPVL